MKNTWHLFPLCGIWLTAVSLAFAQEPAEYDLVTMKNGDIFHGRVDLKQFVIATGYGEVSIPRNLTARVLPSQRHAPARIESRFGDQFSGTLSQSELIMSRVLDPPLPLRLADIAEITMAPGNNRVAGFSAPDTLQTRQGDLFSGRVATTDFIVRNPAGVRLIRRADIHLMQLAESDDGPIVQITLNGGGIIQGRLMTKLIQARSRFGNRLEIAVDDLISLAFGVNYLNDAMPRFNYRKRVLESALFRDRMRDGSMGPEMIALRGGTFRRGDLQGDGDEDERPPTTIKVKPFAIGIYEVSFDEYDRFSSSARRERPDDERWGRGRRPVINVSWDSAREYTEWLSSQTGESYRLPTDAEWEYAARAGSESRFWWGDEVDTARANCAGCGSLWDGERSSRVGSFEPNGYGLHDTAGNLFEWVEDCWNSSFADAPEDGSALLKPDCGVRVIRGGAWSFPPNEARSANRWRNFQSRRSDDTGFRLVRELRLD